MKKNWSINVTTRNPARLKGILKILANFEGKNFNVRTQAKFIDSVIKAGLYNPIKGVSDKALRGRTWAGIFNTLGFAIAYETYGPVVITPIGKKLIVSTDEQESEIFLRQLLKWQLSNPTPTARGFKNYNMIPFIATLNLIKLANGLSKDEFCLFVPTLKTISDIKNQINLIIEFRSNLSRLSGLDRIRYKQAFSERFVQHVYSDEFNKELKKIPENKREEFKSYFLNKKINNLRDYGDTIIRYFRYTQFISLKDRKIVLSDTRTEELKQLLNAFDGSALKIVGKTQKEILENFYNYLGSIDAPALPYEKVESFIKIILNLQSELKDLIIKSKMKGRHFSITSYSEKDLLKYKISELKSLIYELRENKKEVIQLINSETVRSPDELNKIISVLKDIDSRNPNIPDKSLWLEWYVYLAFKSLDDEELIKPNFPLDENNEPISVAIPNKPDIEAYYSDFVIVPEVTMSARKDQWVREGMPVPRHVLQIKNKETRKVFGLFVAPSIHFDTRNQFFYVANVGIEGGKVTILPTTIKQFVHILEILLTIKKTRSVRCSDILSLIEDLDNLRSSCTDAGDWLSKFDNAINNWKVTLK